MQGGSLQHPSFASMSPAHQLQPATRMPPTNTIVAELNYAAVQPRVPRCHPTCQRQARQLGGGAFLRLTARLPQNVTDVQHSCRRSSGVAAGLPCRGDEQIPCERRAHMTKTALVVDLRGAGPTPNPAPSHAGCAEARCRVSEFTSRKVPSSRRPVWAPGGGQLRPRRARPHRHPQTSSAVSL